MKRMFLLGMQIVLSLCLLGNISFAGDTESERQSLNGLTAVTVVVEEIESNFDHKALSESRIKADIETQLRSAGIKVTGNVDSHRQKEQPLLYVILTFLEVTDNHYDFSISVAVARRIFIEAEPDIEIYENSWFIKDKGTGSLRKYRPKLREMIDRFIAAYFSVNPKTPTASDLAT